MIEGKFFYSGDKVPIGGITGEVLTKVDSPNYYTAWRDINGLIDTQAIADIVVQDLNIDEGEY
jgi:hypothetical protein